MKNSILKRSSFSWPRPLIVSAVILVFLLVGFISLRPTFSYLYDFTFRAHGEEIANVQANESVAMSLLRWEVFGQLPTENPAYTSMINSTLSRIQVVNAYTYQGGWHGDGADWYQIETLDSSADEIRTSLNGLETVKKIKDAFLPSNDNEPLWWPKKWPDDVVIYQKNSEYFVLSATRTDVWFMRIRS